MWAPGEGLMLEATLLAAFMPPPSLAPAALKGSGRWQISPLSCLPSWFNAFAFRLLAFRVLAGFGKHHFIGADPEEITSYLPQFFIGAPMMSLSAYLLRGLFGVEHPIWSAGYAVYFFAEFVCPWGFLVQAPHQGGAPTRSWRLAARGIAAAGSAMLMCGIQLTGLFCLFPCFTAVVCQTSLLGDAKSCRSGATVDERSSGENKSLSVTLLLLRRCAKLCYVALDFDTEMKVRSCRRSC